VPYQFEFSDFEVSCAQLSALMRPPSHGAGITSLKSCLDNLRYFFSNINYAGKIQRPED